MLEPVVDQVLFPEDVGLGSFYVIENGKTYHENAEKKAKAFAAETGLPTIAGDSGFEVEALDGDPGLHSNRWLSGSDDDRNEAILEILDDIEADDPSERGARFVTVLALVFPDQDRETIYFEGEVKGEVSFQAMGNNGFAYDRILIPEGYNQTFAQLGSEVKDQMSHRADAIRQLIAFLENVSK